MKIQKREKRMLIGLAVVAIFSGIMLYRIYYPSSEEVIPAVISESSNQNTESSTPSSRSGGSGGARPSTSGGTSVGSQNVSLQEFENHSSLKNCWVLIDGEVFDISSFLTTYQSLQETAVSFCGTVGFEVGFIDGDESLKARIKLESQRIGTIS